MRYLFPLLFIALIGWSSCEKSGPADAVITVTDSTGKRVSGAIVVLRQDSVVNSTTGSQAVINESKTTDAAGQAAFSFRLEAVLNVEVTKGTKSARDYIRLEQSKEVAKTVVIR
jgi:hypothetical protein